MNEYARYYKLLGLVLIEIRAATDLNQAQALADVVHNVPNSIQIGRAESEIEAHLMARAGGLGLTNYFQKLLISCDTGQNS